jgi:hypothetical protein
VTKLENIMPDMPTWEAYQNQMLLASKAIHQAPVSSHPVEGLPHSPSGEGQTTNNNPGEAENAETAREIPLITPTTPIPSAPSILLNDEQKEERKTITVEQWDHIMKWIKDSAQSLPQSPKSATGVDKSDHDIKDHLQRHHVILNQLVESLKHHIGDPEMHPGHVWRNEKSMPTQKDCEEMIKSVADKDEGNTTLRDFVDRILNNVKPGPNGKSAFVYLTCTTLDGKTSVSTYCVRPNPP